VTLNSLCGLCNKELETKTQKSLTAEPGGAFVSIFQLVATNLRFMVLEVLARRSKALKLYYFIEHFDCFLKKLIICL